MIPEAMPENQMCEGPCDGAAFASIWIFDPPLKPGTEPEPGQRKGYCTDCARFRMGLEAFPSRLEDLPIREIEDPYAGQEREGEAHE